MFKPLFVLIVVLLTNSQALSAEGATLRPDQQIVSEEIRAKAAELEFAKDVQASNTLIAGQLTLLVAQGTRDEEERNRLFHDAETLFTAAARLGEPEATIELAKMSFGGAGKPKDAKLAIRQLHKAEEAGSAKAAWLLSVLYSEGEGVDKNIPLSALLLRRGAEGGDKNAQLLLAAYHSSGLNGVMIDYVRAYAFYNLAASQGAEMAAEGLSLLTPLMTKAQIAAGQAFGAKLERDLADQKKQRWDERVQQRARELAR